MAEADLSKIVNMIMENPKLVEEIRDMVSRSEKADDSIEDTVSENEKAATAMPEVSETDTYVKSHSSRRNDLLRAMRPYLSEKRGSAIESMITIADILFTIREK